MTFEEYITAIQKLAEAAGATSVGIPYCDVEAWREAFNDGVPPQEAWDEEVSAASQG